MVKHVTTYRKTATSGFKRKYITRKSPSPSQRNLRNGNINSKRRVDKRETLKELENHAVNCTPNGTEKSNNKIGQNYILRKSTPYTRCNSKNGSIITANTRGVCKGLGDEPVNSSHNTTIKTNNRIKQKCITRKCAPSTNGIINTDNNYTANITTRTVNKIEGNYLRRKSTSSSECKINGSITRCVLKEFENGAYNSVANATKRTVNKIKRKYVTRKLLSSSKQSWKSFSNAIVNTNVCKEFEKKSEKRNINEMKWRCSTRKSSLYRGNLRSSRLRNNVPTNKNNTNVNKTKPEIISPLTKVTSPVFKYIRCRTCRVPCDEILVKKLSFNSACIKKIDISPNLFRGESLLENSSDVKGDDFQDDVSNLYDDSNSLYNDSALLENSSDVKSDDFQGGISNLYDDSNSSYNDSVFSPASCTNIYVTDDHQNSSDVKGDDFQGDVSNLYDDSNSSYIDPALLENSSDIKSDDFQGGISNLYDDSNSSYNDSVFSPASCTNIYVTDDQHLEELKNIICTSFSIEIVNERDNYMSYKNADNVDDEHDIKDTGVGDNSDYLSKDEDTNKDPNETSCDYQESAEYVGIEDRCKFLCARKLEKMYVKDMKHTTDENGNFMGRKFKSKERLKDIVNAADESELYEDKKGNSDVGTSEDFDKNIGILQNINADLLIMDANANELCKEKNKENEIIFVDEDCHHSGKNSDSSECCKCKSVNSSHSNYIRNNKEVDMKENKSSYYCKKHNLIHCRKHVRLKESKEENSQHSPSHISAPYNNQLFKYIFQSSRRLKLLHNRIFHTPITPLNENIMQSMLTNIEIDIELFKENSSYDAYKCEWNKCNKLFDDSNKLLDHLEEIHICPISTNSVFICLWQKCKFINQPSSSYKWLSEHVLRHCCARPFRCVISGCESSFATQNGLAHHVPSHFNEGKVRRTCVLTSIDKGLNHEYGTNNKVDLTMNSVDSSEDTDESSEPIRKRSRYEKFVDKYKGRHTDFWDDQGVLNNIKYRLQISTCDSQVNCGYVGQYFRFNHKVIGKRTSTDGSIDMLLSPSSTKMFPLTSFWFDERILEGEKSLVADINVNNLSDDMKQQFYDNELSFNLYKKRITNNK